MAVKRGLFEFQLHASQCIAAALIVRGEHCATNQFSQQPCGNFVVALLLKLSDLWKLGGILSWQTKLAPFTPDRDTCAIAFQVQRLIRAFTQNGSKPCNR